MEVKTKKLSSQNLTTSRYGTADHLKTFADHIKELRGRLLWVVVAFLALSALAYNFKDALVEVILRPLNHQQLIYLTPGGGFSFIFQVTVYAALVAVAPLLMYHLYCFLHPALPVGARRSTLKIITLASGLLMLGVSFGYFIAIPAALRFLSEFAGANITPNLTADSYLHFFLGYVAGLGLLFQLPLLLLLWHWIKPFTPNGLLKSERFIIIFAFIAAALLTPTPDVFNQAMIAIPLILVYQFGVVAILLSIIRENKRAIATPVKARCERAWSAHQDVTSSLMNPPQAARSRPTPSTSIPAASRIRQITVPQRTPITRRPVSTSRRPVSIDGISLIETQSS